MTDRHPIPLLEEVWDEIREMQRTATTPIERCNAQLLWLQAWMNTIHDTTEQLVGDPNWRDR